LLRLDLTFFSGWPRLPSSYFKLLPSLSWQMHATTPSFFLLRWSLKNLCAGWSETVILPISLTRAPGFCFILRQHLTFIA
jgi:hypothetical protein